MAVKAAGFYPVSEGIEGGVEHLRAKVEEGYSLIVFPEGTRSKSNHIQRFHKGAFYLADYFNLDIIPVVIQGNSEALPKGDFIIYDGSITVKILERIAPDNKDFGDNYTERTKKVSAYFKSQFNQMRETLEDVDYFRKTLINSFDYKEPEVVEAVKKDIAEKMACYHELNSQIGEKASVLRLADDYGQWDALLALQQPQRRIDCVIADDKKRAVAKMNYIVRKRHIQYLEEIQAEVKYDILLITIQDNIPDIADVSDRIIVLESPRHEKALLALGFETAHQGNGFVVFKRK
jgi:hypothetical protein